MVDAASRALIIEDERPVAELLRRALALGGYRPVVAASAAEAWRALAHGRFELLTLDLFLPDGYGLELLAQLRAAGLARDTPVIVITTSAVPPAVGLAAYDALLLKPFSIGELLELAAELCGADRARAFGE